MGAYETVAADLYIVKQVIPTTPLDPGDPITYVIEYRQEGVLQHRGERYPLDHDFPFPDRVWPISGLMLSTRGS